MYSLIIGVIAIIVLAILTLATLWLGGEISSTSADKGRYSQYLNHSEQIAAAMRLYQHDKGERPTGSPMQIIQALTAAGADGKTYLSTVPQGEWYMADNTIYRKLMDGGECKRMNTIAGKAVSDPASSDGCPPCDAAEFSDWPACARATIEP